MTKKLSYFLSLFVTFVNVANLFLVIPFKIRWNNVLGYEVIKANKWKKFACFLTIFGSYIAEISLLIRFLLDHKLSQRSPNLYFTLARHCSTLFFFLFCLRMIAFRTDKIQSLINHIQWNKFLHKNNTNHSQLNPIIGVKMRLFNIFFIFFFLFFHYFLLIFDKFRKEKWDIINWIISWKNDYLKQYFLTSLPENIFISIFATSTGFCCMTAAVNFQFFTQWLPLVGALLMYAVVNQSNRLTKPTVSSNNKLHLVINLHAFLRKVFEEFNEIFGEVTFGLTVVLLPQLVYHLNEILDPTSHSRFIRNLIRFIHFFSFILICAVVNTKTNILHSWIIRSDVCFMFNSTTDLSVLMYEATVDRIGIYVWGFFKITIGLVASVLTALITFTIIILQFQNSGC